MLIYPKIWEQGVEFERVGPGYHYKQRNVKSIVVPEGQVVTFYEHQDRTGKKSLPFYEGAYHHLDFYGVGSSPGVIHVEETELTTLDMIEVAWDVTYGKGKDEKYPMFYRVPIGDREFGTDFPNDRIQTLRIPFGLTVEVFADGSFKGGSLIFSGNTENGVETVKLWEFDYGKRVSSMKVRADKWVPAGIAIENEVITNGEKTAATTEIANNSPHKASCSKEIIASVDEGVQENWNIGGRVAAKAGFEATAMGVTVSGEVEVEVSGGYGEEKTTSRAKSFADVGTVELDGFGRAKLSMIIEIGEMEADAIRKWRNTRNNSIIEQRGRIKASWANKARIEIN